MGKYEVDVQELMDSLPEELESISEGNAKFHIITADPPSIEETAQGIRTLGAKLGFQVRPEKGVPSSLASLLGPGFKGVLTIDKPPVIELVMAVSKIGLTMEDARRSESSMDPDILGGMMEAVRNFTQDSLQLSEKERANGIDSFERFEMHGYCILTYIGKNLNLSFIIKGEVTPELKEDITRVEKHLEEQFGKTLEDWDGNCDSIKGMRDMLENAFILSGRYEGEWDYANMKSKRLQVMEDVLAHMEHLSRTEPLIIMYQLTKDTTQLEVNILEYLVRNTAKNPILTVIFDPGDVLAKPVESVIMAMSTSKNASIDLLKPYVDAKQVMDKLKGFMDEPDMQSFLFILDTLGSLEGWKDLTIKATGKDEKIIQKLQARLEKEQVLKDMDFTSMELKARLHKRLEESLEDANDRAAAMWNAAVELECMNELASQPGFQGYLQHCASISDENSTAMVHVLEELSASAMAKLELETCVELLRKASELAQKEKKLDILSKLVELESSMSMFKLLERDAPKYLDIANEFGDSRAQGIAHTYLLRFNALKNDFERCYEHMEEAQEKLKDGTLNDRFLFMFNKGYALIYQNELEHAKGLYLQLVDLAERENRPRERGRAFNNLGMIYSTLDDNNEAVRAFMECHDIYSKLGVQGHSMSALLSNITSVFFRMEDYEKSLEWGQRCYDYCIETRNPLLAGAVLQTISLSLVFQHNDLEKADKNINEALVYGYRINHKPQIYVSYAIKAMVQYYKASHYARITRDMEGGINKGAFNNELGRFWLEKGLELAKKDVEELMEEDEDIESI